MFVLDCGLCTSLLPIPCPEHCSTAGRDSVNGSTAAKKAPKGNYEIGYRGVGKFKCSHSRYSQDAKVLSLYTTRSLIKKI